MSRTVRVDLGERGYDILIGSGMTPGACLEGTPASRAVVVTDSNVEPLQGARCQAALEAHGACVRRLVLPAGEGTKTLDSVRTIYEAAIGCGLDRTGILIALGGGVIGDLTGFAAATYLRGIPYLQAPTTLLAMVDSSVGGKTGVNLPQGKNLVGAFHQPAEVAADLDCLRTLPAREFASGLAEVVKYGVIWDATLFARIERDTAGLLKRDTRLLEDVVARCCEIKSEIVAVDERESGVRAILNFGHTLGHALESVGGYGSLLHGEAVALGMVYAAELSVRLKGMDAGEARRVRALLTALGLPVALPRRLPWKDVRDAMASDKKSRGGLPRFVLAEKPGAVVFGCEVSEPMLEEVYGGMPCQP